MADILELDALSLYMGDPYVVNQYITIKQPTVGQITKYNEQQYYSMVYTLTATGSDMKSQL